MFWSRRLGARRALFALTLSLTSLPVFAGPITSIGGYWGPMFYDTTVVCGAGCSTDQYQYANYDSYDLLGTNGVVRQAHSGSAYAALSVVGVGTEVSTDNFYQYQLTVARSFDASVSPNAPANAFAQAQAGLTGLLGFELSETVRYLGTSFGSITSGAILGPGRYEGFFGSAFSSNSGTAVVRAGQQDFGASIGTFIFRVESVAVPEPATFLLFGAGLLGIVVARKRKTIAGTMA
jgi:hypothetical protein